MADEFGQRIQGLHQVGDSVVSTDKHIALLGEDNSNTYQYLQLDASGNLKVTGGGGGTQYQVSDVAGATDTGTVALVVRVDTPATLTEANGDYSRMQVDSLGQLWVTATDLDIRALTNTDVVTVEQSTAASLNATVEATDLDIRDLTSVSDSVEVLQDTAADLNATVVATDLDIRDLSDSQDSVQVGDGTTQAEVLAGTNNALYTAITDGTDTLAVNGDGSINVVTSESANDSVYTYGSANLVKDTETTVVTTSPGSDEYFSAITVSGFGYCIWHIYFGTTSSENVIATLITTPSSPTAIFDLPDYLEVSSGETLYVSGENKEKKGSPASDFTGYASLVRKV